MSGAKRARHAATILLYWTGLCLAQANASPEGAAAAQPDKDAVLALRLSDGTVVHVSSDAADTRIDRRLAPASAADSAASARRVPPRRPVRVFDPQTPGAIASVRG